MLSVKSRYGHEAPGCIRCGGVYDRAPLWQDTSHSKPWAYQQLTRVPLKLRPLQPVVLVCVGCAPTLATIEDLTLEVAIG